MSLTDKIKEKIIQGLNPVAFELTNESALHAGHAGDNGTGESHFRLFIVSAAFNNQNRLERYRLVHRLLEQELHAGVHAMTLDLKTPAERDGR